MPQFELLVEHGRAFEAVAPCPLRLHGRPRMCFSNSSLAVIQDPKEYWYCEGYALKPDSGAPVEHAWLLDHKGRVIDPTWPGVTDAERYWGIVFRGGFVRGQIAKNLFNGVLWDMSTVNELTRSAQFRMKAFAP